MATIRAKEAKEWVKAGRMPVLWAPLTMPFTSDLKRIDEPAFRENIQWCMKLGCQGLAPNGQLAEPFNLSLKERMQALEIGLDEAKDQAVVYAYPVCDSLPEAIRLAQHAQSVGAAFLMANVSFEHVKSHQTIYEYYKSLAEHTDIAICLLNTWHSGYIMPPELIKQLAQDISAVCAIKNPVSFEHTVEVWRQCGHLIEVDYTREGGWFESFQHEGMGHALMTTSCYLMQVPGYTPVKEYTDMAFQGRLKEARQVFDTLDPLRKLRESVYHYSAKPEVEGPHVYYHPVAAVKFWEDCIGMHGGSTRPPSITLNEREFALIENGLRHSRLAPYLRSNTVRAARK